MNVQFFLDKIVLLLFWVVIPPLLRYFAAVQHGCLCNGICACYIFIEAYRSTLGLEFPLQIGKSFLFLVPSCVAQVRFLVRSTMYPFTHNLLGFSPLHVLVFDP